MRPRTVCLCLAISLACAAATAAHAFQLREKTEKLSEGGERTVSVLQCHNLDFSFLRPGDWVMVPDAGSEKIAFRTRDFAVRVVMQIRTGHSAMNTAELRKKVLDEIPNATITEESKCYASNSTGQAFDLRLKTGGLVTTCCQVAFVPFAGGCVEFTVSASPSGWPAVLREFGAFLTSFNIEPSARSSP